MTIANVGALGDPVRLGGTAFEEGTELEGARDWSFRSVVVVPSNSDAVDAALLFSSGLETLVAIHGPSGYGKTHLLSVVHHRLRRLHGAGVPPIADAAVAEHGNGLENASEPVLLDNAEVCLGRSRHRQRVHLLLERRVRAGRPTLVAFGGADLERAIRRFLPQHRSWRIEALGRMSAAERLTMLRQMSASLDLRVGDPVLRLLAESVRGCPGTMRGVLTRMLSVQRNWDGPWAVLEACGALAPVLSGDGLWDARDHILQAVETLSASLPADLQAWEVASYAMIRAARVPEEQAAAALGVEPGRAYAAAAKVEGRLRACAQTREAVRRTIETAKASLCPELPKVLGSDPENLRV